MGSVGDSYDNALMENFFSRLKTELVYRNSWRTREEAENALFAYIDAWYNTQRIQKKLGWRSPDEFEAIYHHPGPSRNLKSRPPTKRGNLTASYVARLSILDGRPAGQQRSEMAWLESLAASGGVAVPGPIATTEGDHVVPITVPGHDQPATLALLHWVPGTAEPPYQRPGIAARMGAATAHLHRNAATVEIPDFDRPTWDHETIVLEGAALADPEASMNLPEHGRRTLRAVADRITHALAGRPESEHRRIHGDLHRENMIALPTGGVGIIDFDDCGWGSPVLDIATVLSSIYRIAHTTPGAYDQFAHRFLDGYAEVFELPEDLDDLLEPYLVLRDCFVLNFVSGALSNASVAAWGHDRIAGILATMDAYLAGQTYPGGLY